MQAGTDSKELCTVKDRRIWMKEPNPQAGAGGQLEQVMGPEGEQKRVA